MALMIKGKMPIECKNCWFAELETGGRNFFCVKQIGKRFSVELAEQRQEGCPIIGEIPDERGDLKDVNVIEDMIINKFGIGEEKYVTPEIYDILLLIKKAPTVVKASI